MYNASTNPNNKLDERSKKYFADYFKSIERNKKKLIKDAPQKTDKK
jgi:hypothetical protein